MSEEQKVKAGRRLSGFGIAIVVLLALLGAAVVAWILFFRPQPETIESNTIYVVDASARMLLPLRGGSSTRLEAARNLVDEMTRGASATAVTGIRLFGSGATGQPCADTTLLVPPAANNQRQIAQKLAGIQTGPKEAALIEAIVAAIRDLRQLNQSVPRLLVVVTGGEDTCVGDRNEFIVEELNRANINLRTLVIDLEASQQSAQALKVLVANLGGGTYVDVQDETELAEVSDDVQSYLDQLQDAPLVALGEQVAAAPDAVGAATATASPRIMTATPTSTASPPANETVLPTATPIRTSRATATPRGVSPTNTPTVLRTATTTATTTATPTTIASPTATRTPTATSTPAVEPPASTFTATPTPSGTVTVTATTTSTPTPTVTPTEWIVDGNCPDSDGDGRCDDGVTFKTIQAAIDAAASGDTVQIVTTGAHVEAEILVYKSLTILGQGVNNTIVQAAATQDGANSFIFHAAAATTVTLQALAIQYGLPGIINDGTLTLNGTTVQNNGPVPAGAGILNNGTLTVNDSTISGNRASSGGGIHSVGGTVTINRSTIVANTADPDNGAGLFISGGQLTINNSTISQNTAVTGGGGLATGAADASTQVTINNSTLVENNAGLGGGIAQLQGAVTVRNSIVANNGGGDCSGSFASAGYNLSSDATCSFTNAGDQENTAPHLTPLQNNGGLTLTHAPLYTSPAIDAGNPAAPGSGGNACWSADQRGQTRPLDGNGNGAAICDVGAVEVAFTPPTLPKTAQEITIDQVTINQAGQIVRVAPGATVNIAVDYFIQDTVCPDCVDQILIGIADDRTVNEAIGCVYDGVPGPGGVSGSGSVSLTASATAGNYAIRFRQGQDLACNLDWWNVDFTPGPDRNIGYLVVSNN